MFVMNITSVFKWWLILYNIQAYDLAQISITFLQKFDTFYSAEPITVSSEFTFTHYAEFIYVKSIKSVYNIIIKIVLSTLNQEQVKKCIEFMIYNNILSLLNNNVVFWYNFFIFLCNFKNSNSGTLVTYAPVNILFKHQKFFFCSIPIWILQSICNVQKKLLDY